MAITSERNSKRIRVWSMFSGYRKSMGAIHSARQALKLGEDLLPDMRCPCEKHIAI